MNLQWDLCRVLSSEVDADGFIGVGYDLYGGQQAGAKPMELHAPYGFRSRPLDPEVDANGTPLPGKACNVLTAWEGNEGHAWLASDPRVSALLPPLEKGEQLMHGPTGNFFRCHQDGSCSIFTTSDATETGTTVSWRFAPDGESSDAPWGKFSYDVNGYHVRTHSGARLDMGGIGGMPAPLDALGSYATLQASMLTFKASIIKLGPAGVPAEPVVKAISLQAVLATVATALAAIQAAMATITTTTPGSTAAAASAVPVGLAVTAIGTALATIASTSTTAA